MPTIYEGPHAAQFILTEANGQRSRENVEIPVGQKFLPGTVITGGGVPGLSGAGLCIAIYGVDTTAADAVPVKIAVIARDAEVNRHAMAWPEGTDDSAIDAACMELADRGIIVRGAALPSPSESLSGFSLPSPGSQRVGEQRAGARDPALRAGAGAGAGNPQPGSGSGIPVTESSGPNVQRPGDAPVKS
jgi:Bacteriophage lambda head decoration protein D